jgi:hypothetical protein
LLHGVAVQSNGCFRFAKPSGCRLRGFLMVLVIVTGPRDEAIGAHEQCAQTQPIFCITCDISNPAIQKQRVSEPVPDLRIVDQDLWERVQDRLGRIRQSSSADYSARPRYWETRRARHLLTGKAFCGCCGGAFASVGKDYLACAVARRQDKCTNQRRTRRDILDGLVLDALQERLMEPELAAIFAMSSLSSGIDCRPRPPRRAKPETAN